MTEMASLRIERRGEGAEARDLIVGHASVFDQWTTLYNGRFWEWREIIRPGAFTNAIAEKQDVRALFNHDANFVLGRTKAGTLALSEDKVGLLSITEPPATQTVRDMVLMPIERGDISGMSFAWTPRRGDKVTTTESADGTTTYDLGGLRITTRYEGDKSIEEWEVLDANLFDISPVTYPAYDGTDVSLRSSLGIEERAKEMDVPHKRPAPKREEVRRWLASSATVGR